jgi:hypothetical protein
MRCGHDCTCCCCARLGNDRCFILRLALVDTPVGTPLVDILCTQEDLGWQVDGRVALEMLAGVPVWLAELGKTTPPSAAKAEQYAGTEIAGSLRSY